MRRKSVTDERFESEEDIPTKSIWRRTQLFWRSLPAWLRVQYVRALREAASNVVRKLLEHFSDANTRDVVQMYLLGAFLEKFRQLREFNLKSAKIGISHPLFTLHSNGFWLDELYFPEETVWLSMTVPRRVWWWLVMDPVKRAKFFEFVNELFKEDIPVIEITDGDDSDASTTVGKSS
jgi:hypothetical protein